MTYDVPTEGAAGAPQVPFSLASFRHELKTPLNGILGMVAMVADTPLDDRQSEMVATIERGAERLLGVVDELLELCALMHGDVEREATTFDPVELLEEVGTAAASRARPRGVELLLDLPLEVPRSVTGDVVRIRQVVTRLVQRGFASAPGGEVSLALRCSGRAGVGDPELHVWVEHDEAPSSEPVAGAGGPGRVPDLDLGLTLCRELATWMGGRLEDHVVKAGRRRFELSLALQLARRTKPTVDAEVLRGRSVLVAASPARLRRNLRQLLTGWGCWVREASSAEGLLDLVARLPHERWDLIVVDDDLPGFDGETLVEDLEVLGGEAIGHVLIMAAGERPSVAWLREHGFGGLLAKPLHHDILQGSLTRVLRCGSGQDPLAPQFDLRVLLVDDNPVNLAVLRTQLKGLGCQVEEASSGHAACEHAGARPFDLVLMDVHMPDMDGLEATRRIRDAERAAGSAPVPIHALSAHLAEGDLEACLTAGMDGRLPKPAAREVILELLERAAVGRAHAVDGNPCGDCSHSCRGLPG